MFYIGLDRWLVMSWRFFFVTYLRSTELLSHLFALTKQLRPDMHEEPRRHDSLPGLFVIYIIERVSERACANLPPFGYCTIHQWHKSL